MPNTPESIGLIGYGNFARLIPDLVPDGMPIAAYDINGGTDDKRVQFVEDIKQLEKSSVLVLAVPLRAYHKVLGEVAQFIAKDTLLIDICSVKVLPTRLIDDYLPNHPNQLLTHPNFGRISLMEDPENVNLVVTRARGNLARLAIEHCKYELGLNPIRTTAEEHDKQMGPVHSLTFFCSLALQSVLPNSVSFAPPSYSKLQELAEIVTSPGRSNDLFETIEKGNLYASAIRKALISEMQKLDEQLDKGLVFD